MPAEVSRRAGLPCWGKRMVKCQCEELKVEIERVKRDRDIWQNTALMHQENIAKFWDKKVKELEKKLLDGQLTLF